MGGAGARCPLHGRGRPGPFFECLALLAAGLRSYFGWLVAVGELASNPATVLRTPRRRQRDVDYLTKAETFALLYGRHPGYLEPTPRDARNRLLWPLAYWAGLRIGEMCALTVEDIEIAEGGMSFEVTIRDAKWGAVGRREVPDRITTAMLVYYLDQQRNRIEPAGDWLFPAGRVRGGRPAPLSTRQARRLFDAAWRAAGINRRGRQLHPHILRHSLATHLVQDGRSLPDIQAWLRHRSASTTARYTHARDQAQLRRALFRADHLQPKPQVPLLGALAQQLK